MGIMMRILLYHDRGGEIYTIDYIHIYLLGDFTSLKYSHFNPQWCTI